MASREESVWNRSDFCVFPWLSQDKCQAALSASPHGDAYSHTHLQLTLDSSQSPFKRNLEVGPPPASLDSAGGAASSAYFWWPDCF